MKGLLYFLAASAGGYATQRILDARAAGVPLDRAFKTPFTPIPAIKAKMQAQAAAEAARTDQLTTTATPKPRLKPLTSSDYVDPYSLPPGGWGYH